ncbi:MAG: ABC transporter permease [Opitutales bacterium]
MITLLRLIAKDFRIFWADKLSVALTFLVPMVLITIFGMVFGGFGGGGPSGVRVMVVDQAQSEASRQIIGALEAEEGLRLVTRQRVGEGDAADWQPLTEEIARERLASNADTWRFLIIFPPDFQDEVFGFNLKYVYNPRSDVESQIVTGLLQKTFFTEAFPILQDTLTEEMLAELGTESVRAFQEEIAAMVSDTFGVDREEILGTFPEGSVFPDFGAMTAADDGVDEAEATGADPFSFLLDLEEEQVAGEGKPPAAQSVGAWAIMFLLFSMTGAASSLFEERAGGIFHRLLAGPVTRSHILWSKFFFLALLGLFQLTVLLAFGHVLFGIITSVDQLLPLAVISAVGALASTAFGMVLCAFSRTPAQANGLGTLLILSMSALGGAMVPAFLFPAFIRDYLSPLTLVYWMMDGMLQVLWEDAQVVELWLNLAILGAFAILAITIAQWRFLRGDLFR